jgi:hypothetical protein
VVHWRLSFRKDLRFLWPFPAAGADIFGFVFSRASLFRNCVV